MAGSQASRFAARTEINQQQLRYFAAGICGLVAVFVLAHWLRILFNKLSPSSKNPVRTASRFLRSLLVRKLYGFTSSSHALVVAAYVAINLALTFTNVTISAPNIANRCGWMAMVNFSLVVFLALKNTPLAFLTAYSYERLNVLHQIAGYTTFLHLILHASMYTNYFLSSGRLEVLQEPSVIAGIVAGFAFLGLFLSGALLRHWWYEAFLAIHILSFLAGLIAAAYHQPDLATNGLLVMPAVIAAMWGADRVVRGARMLVNALGSGSYAVVEPLPHGGTRIVLAKRPFGCGGGAVAGRHCFVWIPAIRAFESHPFTIAASAPVEFVVNSYDGFTRDLHAYAVRNPGARLRASVDGPYGTVPDPLAFDKVVLIAGGSGATFTFGLVANMLERMGPGAKNDIVFIWSVKKHANLSWFADHLQILKTHPHSPKLTTSLYISEASTSSSPSSSSEDVRRRSTSEGEKTLTGTSSPATAPSLRTIHLTSTAAAAAADPEKDAPLALVASSSSSSHGHAVRFGRPDTATLIREAVAATPATGRVLVAACGPEGLMRVVRDVTAGLIGGEGAGVELHCESFGW